VRRLGIEVFAENEQVQRTIAADVVGEPREAHAPARHHADVGIARSERCGGGSEAHVTGHGDCKAAADAPAADGGDNRLGKCLDPVDEGASQLPEGRAGAGAAAGGLQVGPGAERLGAGAGEDDTPGLLARLELLQGRQHVLHQPYRDGVYGRAGQNDGRYTGVVRNLDGLVARHGSLPNASRRALSCDRSCPFQAACLPARQRSGSAIRMPSWARSEGPGSYP
jgi:hypothetical protein